MNFGTELVMFHFGSNDAQSETIRALVSFPSVNPLSYRLLFLVNFIHFRLWVEVIFGLFLVSRCIYGRVCVT